MNSRHIVSILATAFLIMSCSGKSSTSASSDIDFEQDNTKVSSYPCKKALEGVIVYLNLEKTSYICEDEYWIDYDNQEVISKFQQMPTCNTEDKIAVAIDRTTRFTVVCHDRDWFFEEK